MKNERYVGDGGRPPELPPEELAKLDIITEDEEIHRLEEIPAIVAT